MKIKKTIKILVLLSTIILFILSIVLNYIFYKKAFVPLQMLRLDPLELNYYSSSPVDINKKKLIMYYGDSRALNWPFFKNDNYDFINRAIGNQTSSQILGRFEKHVYSYKPQIIVVQMCVNDLKIIPLFPEKKEEIIKSCMVNIKNLTKKAKKINSKVIITTVFPLGDVSVVKKIAGIKEKPIINAIDVVNVYIKSLKDDDVLIFDSFSLLVANNRKINPIYSHDWLHLSKKGYQHLNQNLNKFINDNYSVASR